MLELISDLPDGVLGIKASDEVTAEDYQRVLVPALESKLSKLEKVRLLSVIPPISSLFVAAETRAFPMAARNEALLWAGED